MSNLIDQASLVMIPSGYKEDKIYSQVPTDGSGDLTFTRASDGTRVNSQGLVERVPWNLATYSEDLSNAAWTKQQATVTANATTAPNGTTTADKLIPNTTSNFHPLIQNITTQNGVGYSFSVYAKAAGYNYILCNTGNGSSSGNVGPVVDLTNGTIVGSLNGDDYDAQIENVGNGWYKVSFSFTANATAVNLDINIFPSSTIAVYSGNGTDGVYIWGYQLNEGSLKPYFPTTDRLNVPRLDYSNGCPSLLLEPQRTNLALYSEDCSNGIYTLYNGLTVTSNTTTAPDGTLTADTLTGTSSNGSMQGVVGVTIGQVYTMSVYLKRKTGTGTIQLRGVSNTSTTVSITNEWARYSVTLTAADANGRYGVLIQTSGDEVYAWGFQLEAGSYATSYIPTTAASVTRVADGTQLLGMASGVADGATSATLFLELEYIHESTNDAFCFGQSSAFYPPGRGYIYNKTNGFADTFGGGGFTIPENENVKMIFRLNSLSSTNIFQNGVKGPTRTGTAWSQIEQIAIRGAYASMKVKQMVFFPTSLTDAECIALTS